MKDMQPLLAKARLEGLWLYCCYQNLWFSPDELEQHQQEGRFRWGPVNWELRDPQDRLDELEIAIHKLKGEYNKMRLRILDGELSRGNGNTNYGGSFSMSISTVGEGAYLTCDLCGDECPEMFFDFDEAVEYKRDKRNGWRSVKDDCGNWSDICPDCARRELL